MEGRTLKIAILSRSAGCYSTRRLKEACRARGHTVKVLDTLQFGILIEQGRPRLDYRNRPLGHYDAVIPRIGASITFYGAAVVRQFEQMGVFSLNSSQAITVSRDKLRSIQVLSRHAIGIPATAFARQRAHVLSSIEQVGGCPVVIKLLEGTQGVGVILADNPTVAEAIVETLQIASQNVLIQKFVKESRGRDLRAFVVGDRVVAAMRRIAIGEEFRSNVHRGARPEPVKLDEAYERTAIRAAQIMGLRAAGVDMLESDEGPQVMEVNSSPGLEGIENATGVDVAGAVIAHLEDQVFFPELDLRQRLTLKAGYGVAEFPLVKESKLVGKTLRESGLRDVEVRVLSVTRGSVVMPNPRSNFMLLAGDVVLCYGKLLTLKALIPRGSRRRKSRPGDGAEEHANDEEKSAAMSAIAAHVGAAEHESQKRARR
jgi:ribosomal protein S6--L-glutamate ligase